MVSIGLHWVVTMSFVYMKAVVTFVGGIGWYLGGTQVMCVCRNRLLKGPLALKSFYLFSD